VNSRDVLHWTGPLQNWNFMCAECHSTNVRKNYDLQADSFRTTWSEIDVSCEACHGPGSRHVEWAKPDDRSKRGRDATMGLAVSFPLVRNGPWVFDSGKTVARRATPLPSQVEIETCGRCHVRRSVISDGYRHGESLAQRYRVATLDEELYHADGQQQDEVYEYGSFRQSRMARAGVTCGDCHDPHKGGLRAPGNAMCAKCHLPTKYDAVSHHRHKPGTAAAECVSCHMPARNYMVVDARRDHGFRIPRPDLSILLHTPNACADCHKDKPAAWAANAVERWFGPRDSVRARYAVAITAGREGWPGAGDALIRVAQDSGVSAIQRATAVTLMPRNPTAGTIGALQVALGDQDPLVRRAAVEALEGVDPPMRLRMGLPLLSDSVRSVRVAAVSALAAIPPTQWTPDQAKVFNQALPDYRQAQFANADRAESHLNLGGLAADLGEPEQAEREFRTALRLWPRFASGYVQLAELLRVTGREAAADSTLRVGLATNPGSAELHHALGLSLVRQQRKDEALPELAAAARLRPDFARYAFVYGVALHDTGDQAQGLAVLLGARQLHPWDRDLLQGVVSFAAAVGRRAVALEAAQRLVQLSPGDQDLRRQLQSLERH
jgi:tetratricopeptide (TPR) repeat protein